VKTAAKAGNELLKSAVASDDITDLFVEASPTSFKTFIDLRDSSGPGELTVAINVTLSEVYESGGRIELPLDFTPNATSHPNFDTCGTGSTLKPFFNLVTPAAPDTSSIVKSYNTTDPTKLVINLKDKTDAGYSSGQKTITVRFTWEDDYNAQIPTGTVLWNVQPKAYVDTNLARTAAVSQVKGGSTARINVAHVLLNPATTQYTDGNIVTRFQYTFPNPFMSDIDPNYTNFVYVDLPTSATLVSNSNSAFYDESPMPSPDNPGYTRYWKKIDGTSNTWKEWNYNNSIGSVRSLVDTTFNPNLTGDGQTVTVISGAVYKMLNAPVVKVTPVTTTYTKIAPAQWDFYITNMSAHGTGGSGAVICSTQDGAINDSLNVYLNGSITFYSPNMTKNIGTGNISGVHYEIAQANSASPKVNYYRVRIYATRKDDTISWAQWKVSFEIKSATGGLGRTVEGGVWDPGTTASPTALAASKEFAYGSTLPALAAGEYIDKIVGTPMGTDGVSTGILPPNNGLSAMYHVRAWDGQHWPDGTAIPAYSNNAGTQVTLYYNDADENPQTKISNVFNLTYAGDYPYAKARLISSNATGRLPGETVNYEIQGTNQTSLSFGDWAAPRVAIRVPKTLELVGLVGANAGASTGLTLTDAASSNTYPVTATFAGSDASYNYYLFQANSSYSAPRTAGTATAFTIPVSFQISSTMATGTYTMGPVLISSLYAGTFAQAGIALDGTISGGSTKEQFGFGTLEHYSVSDLASTSLNILSMANTSVSTTVNTSQTTGYQAASVVPAGQNEDVQMKMTITNNGNVTLNSLRVYDILPATGDPLGSNGNITFGGLAALGASPTIRYADGTAALPKYGEHGNDAINLQTATFQTGSGWGTANLGDNTKAVYADFGSFSLAPGASVEIILTLHIPTGANQTAYNQFFYSMKQSGGDLVLNSVSAKAGFSTQAIMLEYNANLPSINPANDLAGMPAANTSGILGAPNNYLTVDSATPTLTGYTFVDWDTAANGTGTNYSGGSNVSFTGGATIPLYAQWTRNTVSVSYNTQDSTNYPADAFTPAAGSGTALFGGKIGSTAGSPDGFQNPGNPARTGYTFAGWYESEAAALSHSAAAWDFTASTVTAPGSGTKTMYAAWDADGYTVSYDGLADVTTEPSPKPVSYTANSIFPINIGTPAKTGYTFTGWTVDFTTGTGTDVPVNTLSYAIPVGATGNVTLTAHWTANPYTLNFNKNTGDTEANPTSKGVTYGVAVGALPEGASAPTKLGHTFGGWATTTNATTANVTSATTWTTADDGEVYAVWTRDNVTVSYDTRDSLNYPVSAFTPAAGSTTALYNGKIGSTAVSPDGSVAPGTPQRTGYTFKGWFDSDAKAAAWSSNTAWNFAADTLTLLETGTKTLYAAWEAATYTINYEGMSGVTTDASPKPANYTAESSLPLSIGNPAKTGYTFTGWTAVYNSATADVITPTTSYAIPAGATGDVTLTAHFSADDITISYDTRGSGTYPASAFTPAPGSETALFNGKVGSTTALPTNSVAPGTPARNGYTFKGWFDSDAKAADWSNNTAWDFGTDTITSATGQTLYAAWQADGFTVNYDGLTGVTTQPSSKPTSYSAESSLPLGIGNPAKTGYTFTGWTAVYNSTTADVVAPVTSYAIPAGATGDVTLTAHFSANDITVSYDTRGSVNYPASAFTPAAGSTTALFGGIIGSTTALPTNSVAPGTPARNGYTFKGWFDSDAKAADWSNNTAWDFATDTITSATGQMLYAAWEAAGYTVNYDGLTGVTTEPSSKPTSYSAESVFPINVGNPAKTGYAFAGWTVDYAGAGNTANDVGTATPSYVIPAGAWGNATLTANWTPIEYTVIYDVNGGIGSDTTRTPIALGDTVTKPTDPTRVGYTFGGWAKTNSATAGESDYASDFTLNAAALTDLGLSATSTTTTTASLYAVWTPIEYTVIYNVNGGIESDTTRTPIVLNGAVTKPANPTRVGYTFGGWAKTDSAVTGESDYANSFTLNAAALTDLGLSATDTTTTTATLYAVWGIDTYAITYEFDNGTFGTAPHADDYTIVQTPVAVPNPTRAGYTFAGWTVEFTSGTGTDVTVNTQGYSIPADSTGDVTLTAHWTAIPVTANTYTLTFDKNAADAVTGTTPTMSVTYGAAIGTLPAADSGAPTRQGYTFSGWATSADAEAPNVNAETVWNIAGDGTAYAVWTSDDADYLVEHYLVSKDGSSIVKADAISARGKTASTATATPQSYTGYTHNPNYPDTLISNDILGDGSLVLKLYYEIDTYTVTFKNYDGKALKTQTVEHGADATAPANPTRSGYTFAGWDKASSAWQKVTQNVTVTATYKATTYTVTFKDYNGTVLKTQAVQSGKSAAAPKNPTRTGYTFAGWNAASSAWQKVTKNVTVTATYKINTYTVTFKDYNGKTLKTQAVQYGKSATAPKNPTRSGYTFTGWDTASSAWRNVAKNVTITAQYRQNSGDGSGGSGSGNDGNDENTGNENDDVTDDTENIVTDEPQTPENETVVETPDTPVTPGYEEYFDPGDETNNFDDGDENTSMDIEGGTLPWGGFAASGAWSMGAGAFSLISVILSLMTLLGLVHRRKERISMRSRAIGIAAIIAGIIPLISWLLMDDLTQPAAVVTRVTTPVLALFAVQLILISVYRILRARDTARPDIE
jgi:uncharacterized repeat protein (TIGR02543 family)